MVIAQLGTRVRADRMLMRVPHLFLVRRGDAVRERYGMKWVPVDLPKPVEGIYVGVRWKQNGIPVKATRTYNADGDCEYDPGFLDEVEPRTKGVLIAYNERCNHLLAPIESVEVWYSESGIWSVATGRSEAK